MTRNETERASNLVANHDYRLPADFYWAGARLITHWSLLYRNQWCFNLIIALFIKYESCTVKFGNESFKIDCLWRIKDELHSLVSFVIDFPMPDGLLWKDVQEQWNSCLLSLLGNLKRLAWPEEMKVLLPHPYFCSELMLQKLLSR